MEVSAGSRQVWKLHQAGAPAANSGAGPAGAGAPNQAVIALV